MTPQTEIDLTEMQSSELPSKTFRIDFENGRICGLSDGLEAMRQAVVLLLSTERYRYIVHSRRYGAELESLIGQPTELALSQAQARISEALLTDDRIISVSEFEFRLDDSGRKWTASFAVETRYGNIQAEKEILA